MSTDPQGLLIRPLRDDDRAAWEPLWDQYLKFYETDLPRDVTDMTWTRFHHAAEQLFALGAFVDGRLAGFAHYLLHRSTWARQCYCYLEDIFVSDDARGGGLGRALIDAVESEACRVGASRLYWVTDVNNARAQVLYNEVAERSSFIQYRKPL